MWQCGCNAEHHRGFVTRLAGDESLRLIVGYASAQAVAQLDSPNTQQKTAETRYLIVIPTV